MQSETMGDLAGLTRLEELHGEPSRNLKMVAGPLDLMILPPREELPDEYLKLVNGNVYERVRWIPLEMLDTITRMEDFK